MRSCYSVPCRFWPDDPNRTAQIAWYWADERAETLPFETAFFCRDYDYEENPEAPIGELKSPRKWRGGEAPGIVGKSGLCGDENAWKNGVPTSEPLPPFWPGTLIPVCCGKPPAEDGQFGGLATGGEFQGPEVSPGGLATGGQHVLPFEQAGGLATGGDVTHPMEATAGGLALGGSEVVVSDFIDQGGLALGGSEVVVSDFIDQGGLALGGSEVVVSNVVDAGGLATGGSVTGAPDAPLPAGGLATGGSQVASILPGSSCATAGVFSLDQQVGATSVSMPAQQWWMTPSLVTGTTYYISQNLNSQGGSISVQRGTSCGSLFSVVPTLIHTNCYSFTIPVNGNVYFSCFGPLIGGNVPYTLKVSTAAC